MSAESRRGKKRVTRMVVFVVLGKLLRNKNCVLRFKIVFLAFIAFAVCWLPIHVRTFVKIFY